MVPVQIGWAAEEQCSECILLLRFRCIECTLLLVTHQVQTMTAS
jgi:hypothetical protein